MPVNGAGASINRSVHLKAKNNGSLAVANCNGLLHPGAIQSPLDAIRWWRDCKPRHSMAHRSKQINSISARCRRPSTLFAWQCPDSSTSPTFPDVMTHAFRQGPDPKPQRWEEEEGVGRRRQAAPVAAVACDCIGEAGGGGGRAPTWMGMMRRRQYPTHHHRSCAAAEAAVVRTPWCAWRLCLDRSGQ